VGAEVHHFLEVSLFGVVDEASGLTALVGAQPSDLPAICADPDFAPYDQSLVHLVIKPHSGAHKVTWVDHEQLVVFYEGVPEGRISCSFQDVTPLAVGTLRSTETLSNVFETPAPGAITWHYRGNGTLHNPTTGQRYRGTVVLGGFAPPGGPFQVDPSTLRLEPIGGWR
jgi:hypothetical protein